MIGKQFSDDPLIDVYSLVDDNKEVTEGKATMWGCTVEYADDRTLQLDLDGDEQLSVFRQRLPWIAVSMLPGLFKDGYGYALGKSKSGNWHVTMQLAVPLRETERILLQVLLGSDINRETLNYARLRKHGSGLICLFRPTPKLLTEGK